MVGAVAIAYLALGSNLGDRLGYLRAAVEHLRRTPELKLVAASPVFETAAVSDDPQPAYLNAVVRAETTLDAPALLQLCLTIERRLGRVRPAGARKAARIIDLDVLLLDDLVLEQPGLTLPHPGIGDRPFVLIPLARVAAAGLRHPLTGVRLDQAVPDPEVRETSLELL